MLRNFTIFLTALTLIFVNLKTTAQTAVEAYGQLSVSGNQMVAQNGDPVQLQGMSLFWSQWEPEFYVASSVQQMKNDWCTNIIRAAMAVEEGGYLTNPSQEEQKVRAVVDAAIQEGMYVIIDWHDHNAEQHTQQAVDFFTRMARDYGQYPNVIYEIYNEPIYQSWSNDIKPYSETVIDAIRSEDPDNIIVVGTEFYSQNVDVAANDPITGETNIMYTLHYYAGTHGQALRDKAIYAMNQGLALFVTEFGTVNADGGGAVDVNSSNTWFDFLDQNNLSYCNWSLCDKDEGSATLIPGTGPNDTYSNNLTTAGNYMYNRFTSNCPVYNNLLDCAGVENGDAFLDDCGECVGGTTGKTANTTCEQDCNGEWGGTAFIDECDNCVGGSTGQNSCSQAPYNGTPHTIPGLIQAEEYDFGGPDVAYFDSSPGNEVGAFRNDDVDIESTLDNGGGYNIGYITADEWIEYTVNVTSAGSYDIDFRVASNLTGNSLHLEMDGVDITGSVSIPNTGGWQSFTTVTLTDVSLTAGEQVLRLVAETDGFNVNSFEFIGQETVDCNGDIGGSAFIDECGNCAGGNTGLTPNEACTDCNDEINGTASIDDCGVCSGGSTGVTPNETCTDCNGDIDGTASIDECGNCTGGNTGLTPNEACTDCNGDINGTASIDECDVCSGGNTGIEPGSSCALPTINSQPADLLVSIGDLASFSVTASGTGTLSYQWYQDGQEIQGATSSTLDIASVEFGDLGNYYVEITDANGTVTSETAVLSTSDQTPYGGSPMTIPGIVEVENYDLGGQDIAYYDSDPGNTGGVYREDDVDLEATEDSQGGGYHIGWTVANEWTEYTVEVLETGLYDLRFRVASDLGGASFHLEVDGQDITGAVGVDNTGGWQSFTDVTLNEIGLDAGTSILRLVTIEGAYNINLIEFTRSDVTIDCNGDIDGTAFIDECGTCSGGNTGITPNPDADNDGIVDCNDICDGFDDALDYDQDGTPNGCDTDDDNDGIADTDDCDPLNANVGTATTWYADADGDGIGLETETTEACTQPDGYVSTAGDLCPTDGNKTDPGSCGCGTSDVDTDNDGTPDCEDQCPVDATKTEPGVCGCGQVDSDIDNDGICDLEDNDLDNDGITSDVDCDDRDETVGLPTTWYADADGDGLGDRNLTTEACEQPSGYVAEFGDLCPNDGQKTDPGTCGCGTSDFDADGDGTLDCEDLCPNDANKTAPGICGCGSEDVDADNDGVCDTEDNDLDNDGIVASEDCDDNDPTVGEPTLWYADADGDGFGNPNVTETACNQPQGYVAIAGDGCVNDANKTEPGSCGCGIADTDSDGDGTPDCFDGCPTNADKTSPGTCGCSAPDTDSDNDGTADCLDQCPNNPDKVLPGSCGCEVADTDRDGDGTLDCNDGCPQDARKTEPGICGCGQTETECLDCDGVAFGNAFLDECENCVGGNTGQDACEQDCNGEWGGTAIIDECDNCTGGSTGLEPVLDPEACNPTATLNTDMTAGMTAYPNPFTDVLTIEVPQSGTVTIVDTRGEILETVDVNQGSNILRSDLNAGLYQLIYRNASGQGVMKVMKH